MDITTVFLDAGGVILDEEDQEMSLAETAVEVLKTVIEDYSIERIIARKP